jgi:hypothetical protein
MIIAHFEDGINTKIDTANMNSYNDLKKEIFSFKYKTNLTNLNDVTLITFGQIIKDNEEFNIEENQVFLVKINIDLELNKIINDDRLIKILSDEKMRKIIYKILENPNLLTIFETYKYQKEFDQIKSMNFSISDDNIKNLLDINSGNLETVIASILNL